MKKLISLLLCAMLLLPTMAVFAAETDSALQAENQIHIANGEMAIVSGAIPAEEGLRIDSVFVHNGALYGIARGKFLLKQKDAQSFATEAIVRCSKLQDDGESYITHLISDGEYIYSMQGNAIYRGKMEGTEIVLDEYYKPQLKDSYLANHSAFIRNGDLYTEVFADDGGNGIAVISLSNKNIEIIKNKKEDIYISRISQNKDGVFGLDSKNILVWNKGEWNPIFTTKDEKMYMDSYQAVYHAPSDSYYLAGNTMLYRVKDGNMEPVSVLSVLSPSAIGFLDDNTLFIQSDQSIELKNINELKMPERTLRIAGLMDNRLLRMYNKANPDFPAVIVDGWSENSQEAALAMKGDQKADVYMGELNQQVPSLIKHSYVEPLDAYPEMAEIYNRMRPYLQKNMRVNDALYMLPYNVYSYNWDLKTNYYAYNVQDWEALGLTEEDVPKTYLDFVKLVDRLYQEHAEEMEEQHSKFFDDYYSRGFENKIRVLNQTIITAKQQGQQPNFDTPAMNELFEAINQNTAFKELHQIAEDGDYGEGLDHSLFIQTEDVVDVPQGYKLMPLTLEAGQENYIVATATVFYVNALSDNKAQAVKFIATAMNNLPERNQAFIYADKNEPVKNKSFETFAKIRKDGIALLEKEIEEDKQNGGKQVKSLTEKLEAMQTDLKYFENNSYILSPEEMELLQAQQNNIVLVNHGLADWRNEQMSQLLSRLQENEISTKEFLTELNRIFNMMEQEEQ